MEARVYDYRFYLLDGRGRVMEVRDLACADDEAADATARRLIEESRHARGIETWLRPRLVSRIGQPRYESDQAGVAPSTSIASTFSG